MATRTTAAEALSVSRRRTGYVLVVHLAGWMVAGLVVGLALGRPWVLLVAGLVVGVVVTLVLARLAVPIVVRASRAVPADRREHARLHNLVDGLCATIGLPQPDILVVDDPAPNGFTVATTHRAAAIAVTTGLLEQVDRVGLEGVLADLLVPIKEHEVMPVTLAAVLLGWPVLLADGAIRWSWWNGGRRPRPGDRADRSNPASLVGFALLGFAPVVAWVMRPVVGHGRGPADDLAAVGVTRYPPALAKALAAVAADSSVTHAATRPTTALWLAAPLALMPDEGRLAWWNRLFAVHAPIEDRVALLREL